MFDYETLRVIWWAILVFLICGFAVLDGFDLGIGMLLPFLGKTDDERRVMLNTVGPTWEGSQTWLITLGGISFGAWSLVYATLFSGLYTGMLVLLFGLILRPVGFDYRSKLTDARWRSSWDRLFFMSSLVVISVILTAGGSLFPFIIPSSIAPSSSLTVWDASASQYTLQLLFFVTILLMPIVMAYTVWVYRVLRGKVTVEDIQKNQNVLY